MIDKRFVLAALVGISALAVAGAPVPAAATDSRASASDFVGSWEVVHTPELGGPPPFLCLFTFHADGTMVESDAGPPTPQFYSAGHGVWKQTGQREITLTYRQLGYEDGMSLTGTLTVRIRLRLNRTKTEISGPANVEFFLPDGTSVFSGTGAVRGVRIHVQGLP